MKIPFNKSYMTGKEIWYIAQAHARDQRAGNGRLTQRATEAGWSNTPTDDGGFSLVS